MRPETVTHAAPPPHAPRRGAGHAGPGRIIAQRAAARAALLWLLLRLGFMAVSAYARLGATLTTPARALLIGVVVLLCAVDARASREPVFHANLGIGARTTLGLAAVVAAALEIVTGMLLALP